MTADEELDVESFAAALAGDEDGRRLLALDALQECDRRGPLPDPVLGPLLDCLRHHRKAVQRTAAEVLALWSRVTPGIREELIDRLGDGEFLGRWGAAFALAKIGPEPATLDVLLETLGQADGDMRWAAEGIVVDLARRDGAIRERLVSMVAGGSPAQRKMAIYCLRDLGDGSPAGLREALLAGLSHGEPGVRLAALSGLVRLFGDSESVVQPVLDLVRQDPDPGVRRAAVSTLGKLGGSPDRFPEISGILDEAAGSDDAGLRRAAIGARQRREGGGEES